MIATAPSKPNIELAINQSLERDVCVRLFLIFINITTSSHVSNKNACTWSCFITQKSNKKISKIVYSECFACFSYIVLQYSRFCYYYSGAGIINMSENQETLQRCRRWLVNNLSVDNIECHLDEILHTDSVQAIMVIVGLCNTIKNNRSGFTICNFSWCHAIEKDIKINIQLNIQCPIHKYTTAAFSGLVQTLH